VVEQKIGEVYQWLLAPTQPNGGAGPDAIARWEEFRAAGIDPLAARAAKKLKNEQVIIDKFGADVLRLDIDRVPLWRGNHVSVEQLEEDFSRYLYLPRLVSQGILHGAIRESVQRMVEGLAYADSYDEATGQYTNLRAGILLEPSRPLTGLLVKPDVADDVIRAEEGERERQRGELRVADGKESHQGDGRYTTDTTADDGGAGETTTVAAVPRRFHGSVRLNPNTFREDAGKVSQEVLQHLIRQLGAGVEITLEIHADSDQGFNEGTVRTVNENCRVLDFNSFGFETD
jgi:hypothetical protein